MQNSGSSPPQAEEILDWLQKEMGYRPQGSYISSTKSLPSVESLRKIFRGNMVPVWNFLLQRVKSEKTVEKIRRNILVHGSSNAVSGEANKNEVGKNKGKKREKDKEKAKLSIEKGLNLEASSEIRETALREREMAEKEVARLRHIIQRQRKDLRGRMLELSREEAERKRILDEKSHSRHKQITLEAYDQQCYEAASIFAEYQKRVQYYVNKANDTQHSNSDIMLESSVDVYSRNEKDAVYSTVKGTKLSEDIILLETNGERNVRQACEKLSSQMIENIGNTFPAYEGSGLLSNPQSKAANLLGYGFDEDLPDDVKSVIVDAMRNPTQLLQAVTAYTFRMKTLISRETEKIDIKADTELLRYKYENNRVTDAASSDDGPHLQYQMYTSGENDKSAHGSSNQLLERQKAHVQQFLATEDALNKAAEAQNTSKILLKRLQQSSRDGISSLTISAGGSSQTLNTQRNFELEVWAKEREAAGLRAGLNTLNSEVQRLNKLCEECKEAEESLRKKWKKIEEFDARRSELDFIYTALLQANKEAAAFWDRQHLDAREYASNTIVPACNIVVELSNRAKNLIEKEVSAFCQTPDNSLYMMPTTPQALLESMGVDAHPGPDAISSAERNATWLTSRAGAGDPSAVPTICRISASLQYPSGFKGADAGLASALQSMEFCLKLRGSEASVMEDLLKAINLVHSRRDLIHSSRSLLNHAYRAQQEHQRTINYCLTLASEQERIVSDKWLPELRKAVLDAQRCLEDCKRVRGLVDEWWDQPAATAVDWVTVEGQNVAAWLNHVKQLQMAFYEKELL